MQKVATDLVSNGTLLLSTQLSCSCTDSGVVGPSPGAGGGAWMGLRRPLSVLRLRELAEDWWCDSVWWLCGGGIGGRRVDWLWWFGAPGEKMIEKPFYQAVNQLSIGTVKNCVKRCRKCKRNNSTVRVECNQNKHQIRDERTLSVMTACQSCCYSFFPNSHAGIPWRQEAPKTLNHPAC